MSYFSENYSALDYPLGDPGLRLAQVGAIHAIAAHFTVLTEPALVVMPTGSGKTAVLLAAPFAIRANRVLIITPSKLVREQIAEGARTLEVLKRAGALPETVALPKVFEVDSKLSTEASWKELEAYDVVVATPNCTSPEIEGVAKPPVDLFDTVIFDEAHHSAASTWKALLDHFHSARRVLFTATPYRRDKRIIQAKSIYTYPLKKAFADKIFGKVNFIPVTPADRQSPDVAIALKTEEVFKLDRAANRPHVIMVRTDKKTRADDLAQIYKDHTSLKLQVIHSLHSSSFVKKTIERLREGANSVSGQISETALDGVICVNMMGEGFDFPFLKIAAIHTPHQSLAVTLQFIGRFARTSEPRIGEAQFIAVPDEIAGEAEELFHEGAVWNEIVPNLSEARVVHEQNVREVIAGFEKIKIHREEELDLEFDLGSITPFCHAKIYSVDEFSGFDSEPRLPKGFEIVQYDLNKEQHCSILLLKEQVRPRWTDYEELSKVEYDFILTYYAESSQHLFVCSSRRASMSLYDAVGEHYSNDTHKPLPLYEINRVLHDLKQVTLFQVGMKNSVTSVYSESYQTKMGPDLSKAVSDTDGKLNHRGHLYLRGVDNGKTITIGYSSGSKVWSNTSLRVPEIIEWCKVLSGKLTRREAVVTGTTLDVLGVGEPLVGMPDNAIAVRWNDDVYNNSVEVSVPGLGSFQLHDFDIETGSLVVDKLRVDLRIGTLNWRMWMSVSDGRMEIASESDVSGVTVTRKGDTFPLMTYLEGTPFHVYLADFSRISDGALFKANFGTGTPFSDDGVITVDWLAEGINIEKEFEIGGSGNTDNTIHGYLKRRLVAESSPLVIYDHGTGEIGDFLTMEEKDGEIQFAIYHCKGAGGANVGQRVGDVYEVVGQVVKSLIWLHKADDLSDKILSRITNGSIFLKGDRALLKSLFDKTNTKQLEFLIYCVQPGLGKATLVDKLTGPMAAARDYVKRSCRGRVMFMISA